MKLPVWRQVKSGRTFAQTWEPAAVEITRRSLREKLWPYFVAASIAFALFAVFYAEMTP